MIIGVSGKAGSGKDTLCDFAVEQFGAQKIAFAGGLKEEVSAFLTMVGVRFENRNLYGTQEDKEESFDLYMKQSGLGFLVPFASFPGVGIGPNSTIRATFRLLLQWWGTEFRRKQDNQYWVKKALAKCEKGKIWVISDCRFTNEADAILEAGGKVIRVNRPSGIDISNMNHPSEIDLDDYTKWDKVILNDGTLEEYETKCKDALQEVINGKA